MANDWATADTFDAIKLNQKTRFIGTGLQATTFLTSPQVGQMVYPTLNDSTATTDTTLQDAFRHDKFSFYTSAGWKHHTPQETEYTYGNSVSTQTHSPAGGNSKHFIFHTLPSTDKFYKISAIEAGHNTVSGAVTLGVDLCNANPATSGNTLLVALCPATTMGTGYGNVSKVNVGFSKIIKGGSHIGIWAYATTSGQGYGGIAGSGTYYAVNIAGYATTIGQSLSYPSSTGTDVTPALKVYYIGYS